MIGYLKNEWVKIEIENNLKIKRYSINKIVKMWNNSKNNI